MPYLISTYEGGRGFFSGHFWRANPANYSIRTQVLLPPAVSAFGRYSSHHLYSNRMYITGHFTDNLLLDEHYRLLRQGIRPPVAAPTVTLGAGATEQFFYLSFYDELTGERSSLSAAASGTGGLTRTWSGLPTAVPGEILRAEGLVAKTLASGIVTGVGAPAKTNFDMFRPGDRVLFSSTPDRWTTIRSIQSAAQMVVDDLGIAAVSDTLTFKAVSRCSHVECWVSVAGTLPRLAARVRLGTTTFTENVATLSLGEAFLDNFEIMPAGTMNAVYGDRQLVAGVDRQRDTVFLSNLFHPEQFGGLSFKTRYGEPITGLIGTSDYALINTPDSSYILQGYTEDDLTLTVSNPSLGAFGHRTSIAIEQNLWVPNKKSFYIYNGTWKSALADRNTEWVESYGVNQTPFEDGVTIYNPNDATIQFYPRYKGGTLNRENIWVADFSSVKFDAGGEIAQPYWFDDDYRAFSTVFNAADYLPTGYQAVVNYWGYAAYLIPDGQSVGKLYRVSFPSGAIYAEDPAVAYHRDAVLKTRHELFSEEAEDTGGGNVDHGWKLDTLWVMARSELSGMVLAVWPGDEYAAEYGPMGLNIVADINVVQPAWGFFPVAATQANNTDSITYQGSTQGQPPEPFTVRYRRWAPKTVHYFRPMVDGRGHTLEVRFATPLNAQYFGWGGKVIPGRASRNLVDAEHFLG